MLRSLSYPPTFYWSTLTIVCKSPRPSQISQIGSKYLPHTIESNKRYLPYTYPKPNLTTYLSATGRDRIASSQKFDDPLVSSNWTPKTTKVPQLTKKVLPSKKNNHRNPKNNFAATLLKLQQILLLSISFLLIPSILLFLYKKYIHNKLLLKRTSYTIITNKQWTNHNKLPHLHTSNQPK